MFEFRIINLPDGIQVIDTSLKTPYNALTPLQMVEYVEMDAQLATMDKMARKARYKAEWKQKSTKGLLHKIACFCGLS